MSRTKEWARSRPKLDLHRHLEGSIRPETFLEIARTHSIELPASDLEGIRRSVQITDDPPGFHNFLGKLQLFRGFWPDRDAIRRVAYEAVEDAAADNVIYLELRYAPGHFAQGGAGFAPSDVIEWVTEGARLAAAEHSIQVEFIATLGRHYSLEENTPTIDAVLEVGREGFVGLDIAGDEMNFGLEPFRDCLHRAKHAGLGLTLHAGEVTSAAHVRDAIQNYGADRIGHGVQVIKDDSIVDLARTRGTAFEMCLTSNLQTAAVEELGLHPAKPLLDRGLCITLNTDDPSVSRLTLSDEWAVALADARFTVTDLETTTRNAVSAAFLPEEAKRRLLRKLDLQGEYTP